MTQKQDLEAVTDPHPEAGPLDEATEQALRAFEQAASTYRPANYHDRTVRRAARENLRNRIRELVAEAREDEHQRALDWNEIKGGRNV